MATLAQAIDFGYERVRLITEELAVGRWGKLWRVLDMTIERWPAEIGPPFETRWEAVEYAEAKVRQGQYR